MFKTIKQDFLLKNILLDKQTLERGIYNRKYIENLLAEKDHNNYDFWGKKIWMLINLELWMRKSFN
jgi:asparagine synthase (glutamine-hydrolysing)